MYKYVFHVGYFPPRRKCTIRAVDYEDAKQKTYAEMDRRNDKAGRESPVGYDLFLIESDDPAFKD